MTTRCTECRKPVAATEPHQRREVPAGLNMNRIHRMVTVVWHQACWDHVVAYGEESRRAAELQRLADIRSMAEELGMAPERVSAIAAKQGSTDPYGVPA